ncbi:MBL fold metallo-hydrolase [Cryobacterium aureum]|uniref:MBL fold metallo-hydrolase n=1 Tax=Cryobacterium aureum TaxID=995037 RepID=UPI000CF5298D|nr:MBL fold metallo-hydrolase [Cryobacterium aureum]
MPDDDIASLLTSEAELSSAAQFARPTMLLAHNDLLPLPGRILRVLETPGHTVGHLRIVDLDSDLIFTGDHVLPRI